MAAFFLAAFLSGGAVMSVEAAIEGVSPNVDPTVITDIRLPDSYDQDFPDGMPFGYAVVGAKTPYAFGVGVDSEGNIYSASYETQTVFITKKDADGRISLFSPVERIELDAPGLFGLTLDRNDNIVFSGQLAPDGYVARYDRTTKTVTTLVSGLVRPNQMAVDPDNNVYIVTEDGSIFRYNDKDGTVDHLARGIDGFQSCCVDADGNLYILAFGRFSDVPLVGVGYAGGTLRKMTPDGTLETVWQGDDQYVWRARGLAIDDKGYVYMTGEGNVWDNGNSANIVRFDPATRTVEPVTSGMDFATFIAYGSDGRFYQNLARDNLVIAYSEEVAKETVENDWSELGIRVITHGGTYVPDEDGNLMLKIGSLTVNGTATAGKDGRVSGWIRVPCESVPEIDNTWNPSNEGDYPLPSVWVRTEGTVKKAVMPHRVHVRSRWPLPNIYTPAADYRENPGAYLVYFEWIPAEEKAETVTVGREETAPREEVVTTGEATAPAAVPSTTPETVVSPAPSSKRGLWGAVIGAAVVAVAAVATVVIRRKK
jgi:sugar lactone lactonase YvrE